MVLHEFDEALRSTFEPDEVVSPVEGFPKTGVTCFSRTLFDRLAALFDGQEIARTSNGNGKLPVYKIRYAGRELALCLSRVGAPACIIQYEELFAMGLDKLVVFGTCGVLDKSIGDLSIIIPDCAVRDEGTSYHYKKASREIAVNPRHQAAFRRLLEEHAYSYVTGKVWTTDAPYRETRDKVARRRAEGCICVDMECSAIAALAEFRNKDVFQFFYAADNLDSAKWEKRSLGNAEALSDKEKIGLLAIEFAEEIERN
ncbi:MAG: nucleoside phosphorylase [Clostridia bacterium]|nr:nucleoside phosphorylase [Clostridia bacterium]